MSAMHVFSVLAGGFWTAEGGWGALERAAVFRDRREALGQLTTLGATVPVDWDAVPQGSALAVQLEHLRQAGEAAETTFGVQP